MHPLISVIIPCYNVSKYLPECLKSLEDQTIGIDNLEVILVDDASEDDGKTWAQILQFEQKHPESVIAIHHECNKCQGGARNTGLQYASADYIGFVDSDDWIEPDMYLQLYLKMLQNQCDIVDCRSVYNYEDGRQYQRAVVEDQFVQKEMSVVEGAINWTDCFVSGEYGGGIYTGIYRHQLLLDAGLTFPEHLKYEDNYWQAILYLYVRRLYHMGADYYHYRQNDDSTMHRKNAEKHFDRLEIERMKLQKYKELGVFDRFYREIERDFLAAFYVNTLLIMWTNFQNPPFVQFQNMCREIMQRFPRYSTNPYIVQGSLLAELVSLIDKNISESQFINIGKRIVESKNT